MHAQDDPRGFEAEPYLRRLGHAPDVEIDLARAALALAQVDHPGEELAPYFAHLESMADALAAEGAVDSVSHAVAALKRVMVDRFGYRGDQQTYNALDNADLMRVIDRRKGLPVALSILWLHAARARGWGAVGLAFPAHFLIRITLGDDVAIVDPFNEGRALALAALPRLLEGLAGDAVEFSPEHVAPVADRAILLRLLNNRKLRLLRAGRHADAAVVVDRMLWLAPFVVDLWREAAARHGEAGELRHALAALERAYKLAEDDEARHRIAAAIALLRGKVN